MANKKESEMSNKNKQESKTLDNPNTIKSEDNKMVEDSIKNKSKDKNKSKTKSQPPKDKFFAALTSFKNYLRWLPRNKILSILSNQLGFEIKKDTDGKIIIHTNLTQDDVDKDDIEPIKFEYEIPILRLRYKKYSVTAPDPDTALSLAYDKAREDVKDIKGWDDAWIGGEGREVKDEN